MQTPITTDTRPLIQAAMRAAFPAAEERVWQFYAMQEYHLGWRDADLNPAHEAAGKLLRPQLVLFACRAVGGDMAHALPLAAGIQLIHDFSLIHDDIEDNSDLRRGRETVWKRWGLAHGVNAGDGLFLLAHLALHRLHDVGVPAAVALQALRRFDQAMLSVCEGQFLDLSFEGNLAITEDDYLAMIARKTAALFACAAELGALVGGADEQRVQALATFGRSLGLAFQIQDDVLGIWGDPEMTGKPRAADLYRRKLSLPIVHALRHAPDRAELAQIYQRQEIGDTEVGRVLTILDAAGSHAYTETIAAHHHRAALTALAEVRTSPGSDAEMALATIRKMAESLLGRRE